MDRIIEWAKGLKERENFFGVIIRLGYVICANTYVQSAVHIVASCLLGAFCYKEGVLNRAFLWPFGISYAILLTVFGISNYYRNLRGKLVKGYEVAYSQIRQTLQEECRKNTQLYNNIINKPLSEMGHYFADHDVYTEACFRVCAAVEDILCKESGKNCFRVMTFLRTTKEKDQYYINGYSPQEPTPEAYTVMFDIGKIAKLPKDKQPVHAQPFLNERFEPIVYLDKEIESEYMNFNKDHPTKIHISIPCTFQGRVFAALQITSYEKCWKDKLTILDMIKNTLSIYTSYLKVVHVHQMQHELVCAALPSSTQGGESNATN